MRRKLIMVGLAVLLPIGFMASIGTGIAAAKGTTTFGGDISCNLQGTIKLSPAINLTTPVTVPVKVTAKLTNNDCIGLDGTSITQNGETIISSTESLSYTIPPSNPPQPGCVALAGGGTEPIPASTIKWKGTSKITSTVLGASTATITTGSPNSILSVTGTVNSGWITPATYSINLGINTATVAAGCQGKKGLKSFAVNDLNGDNLEIGPAF
jgi:hypothetical protein